MLTRLAHLQRLPDTDDRRQAVPVGRLRLLGDDSVGLGVQLASLAVPDAGVGRTQLSEHGAGDLPGVGP